MYYKNIALRYNYKTISPWDFLSGGGGLVVRVLLGGRGGEGYRNFTVRYAITLPFSFRNDKYVTL